MKDRILKFLESEHISPAEFADKIGVQRSSMSHILNGRNYPSAAFIQKMLQAFPMVNSRWLLIGEGKMNLSSGGGMNMSASEEKDANSTVSGANTQHKPSQEIEAYPANNSSIGRDTGNQMNIKFEQPIIRKEEAIKEPANEVEHKSPNISEKAINTENHAISTGISKTNPSEEKEIEQILFFYMDKTFRIYRPS